MRRSIETLVGAALLATLVGSAPAGAQAPRDRLLAGPAEIDLNDPDLVLLHVGDSAEYRVAHLPGARLADVRTLSAPRGGPDDLVLEMPEPAALEAALEALGVSDGSNIVIYMGNDWITPLTRLVYMLDWAGLGARTRVLDGGLPAWQAEGGAVSAEPVSAGTGRITRLDVRRDLVVDRAWVTTNARADGSALVDARARAVYDGVQPDRGRNGHIPGAASVPWVELYDGTTGRLKSAAELRAIFEEAGVRPGDTVVGYCHIGQYATAMLFAARSLGHEVRLYDGSFQDWASDPASPVEATKGSTP